MLHLICGEKMTYPYACELVIFDNACSPPIINLQRINDMNVGLEVSSQLLFIDHNYNDGY